MDANRRQFFALVGTAPIVLAGLGMARAQSVAPCYDPNALSFGQKNRRRSIGYVDVSADPKKHCSLCSFFTGTQSGCGTCGMLAGAPVNAGAVCDSFAAKG